MTGRLRTNKTDGVKAERSQQVRGLLWLALGVLVFSVLRAGVHRVFGVGWWRLW